MILGRLLLYTICMYLILSLPGMIGIGSVIDWVPGTPSDQKVWGYVVMGLTSYVWLKIIISLTIVFGAYLFKARFKP